MKVLRWSTFVMVLLAAGLAACSRLEPAPALEPLPPAQYLEGALQWLQTNAVMGSQVDWEALRQESLALVPNPQAASDTYPAICLALQALKDGNAWLLAGEQPQRYLGYTTLYPENQVIIDIDPGSPAERAGLQAGDILISINGARPQPFTGSAGAVCDEIQAETTAQDEITFQRPGQDLPLQVVIDKGAFQADSTRQPVGKQFTADQAGVGYIEISYETGSRPDYVGNVQKLIQEFDQQAACGWIIDLRRNSGGNIWSYLAAVGPILGQGDVGGFVYPDDHREPWSYRKGQVYWNQERRSESDIDGPVYRLRQEMPPVALLTSPATQAAGELVVVAFRGRPQVQTFGHETRGLPTLIAHTGLSDGATLFASGAFSFDRTGLVYSGPIAPDVPVMTDWAHFGTEQDPVIQSALAWLEAEPACSP